MADIVRPPYRPIQEPLRPLTDDVVGPFTAAVDALLRPDGSPVPFVRWFVAYDRVPPPRVIPAHATGGLDPILEELTQGVSQDRDGLYLHPRNFGSTDENGGVINLLWGQYPQFAFDLGCRLYLSFGNGGRAPLLDRSTIILDANVARPDLS